MTEESKPLRPLDQLIQDVEGRRDALKGKGTGRSHDLMAEVAYQLKLLKVASTILFHVVESQAPEHKQWSLDTAAEFCKRCNMQWGGDQPNK